MTLTGSQKKLYAAIGIVVVAVIFAFAFYSLYWTHTVEYSLSELTKAVARHDVVSFERYVDLDSFLTKAYDDVMVARLKIVGADLAESPEAAALIEMKKPERVAEWREAILKNVRGESASFADKSEKLKTTDGAPENEHTNFFAGVDLRDSQVIVNEGNILTIAIRVYSLYLEKEVTVKLRMGKTGDGRWRVKECLNMTELELEANRAFKQKDAIVKREIDKHIKISRVDYFAEDSIANVTWEIKNTDKREIKKLTAYIVVTDQENIIIYDDPRSSLEKLEHIMPGKSKEGQCVLVFDQEDSDEAELYSMLNGGGSDIYVEVMSIEFADGTKIERPTED